MKATIIVNWKENNNYYSEQCNTVEEAKTLMRQHNGATGAIHSFDFGTCRSQVENINL